ncbi:helix-turn-helix domain-containing protein [Clostridioides difficile]|nr:helix-turn-helix domain-containing protein [Clostridioides difficile]
MTTICVMSDHIFLDTEYRQPIIHQHLAKHIIVSLSGNLSVMFNETEKLECNGIIIDSNVPHTVASKENKMLVFLIEDTSTLAKNLSKYQLLEHSFFVMDNLIVEQIQEIYTICQVEGLPQSYIDFSKKVFRLLNLNYHIMSVVDSRIQWALNHILKYTYIENKIIFEICSKLKLSQSRFSHLFKEQTGISLNSYLAFSKLRKAYEILLRGVDITTAAMEAGFSSPSHFSASSKKYLGIAASELAGKCRIYFIYQ